MVGRVEIKTTMKRGAGADREYTKEGSSEDNMDSGSMTSNGKERGRAGAQKQNKKETGEYTDI
jgi:hypothetical protein